MSIKTRCPDSLSIPLLNLTSFVIILPALILCLWPFGQHSIDAWFLPAAAVFLAVLGFTWVFYPRCTGRRQVFVSVLLAACFAACISIPFLSQAGVLDAAPKRACLVVGEEWPTTGVDVFCNGVNLGKTPLRISREEFEKKVKPWAQPPRQERLDIAAYRIRHKRRSRFVGYDWIPFDAFKRCADGPSTDPALPRTDDEFKDLFKSARYWWHFESDGHTGMLCLDAGNVGERNGTITVFLSPQVDYPALQPHLDVLIQALRHNDYVPSAEWIAYFRQHTNILFPWFQWKMERDPRLAPALAAVARAEFGLPLEPTPADCARVLDTVLERVEARGVFVIPSLETIALDLLDDSATAAVVRRFKEEMRVRFRGISTVRIDGGQHSTSGVTLRMRSLEYVAKRLLPPELFAPLVYEYSRHSRYSLSACSGFEILASYGTEESERLLMRHLREGKRAANRYDSNSAIQQLSRIVVPEAEKELRNFVRETSRDRRGRRSVKRFIESRIGREGIDQAELATWVRHLAPIEDREKMDLLARIDSSETDGYIRALGAGDQDVDRARLIALLAEHPNPSLDQFVIESYSDHRRMLRPGQGTGDETEVQMASVPAALIGTDTPAPRSFITERLARQDRESGELLRSIEWADISDKVWLLDPIEKLSVSGVRQAAAGVLGRIEDERARALLKSWAEDPDEDVRRAVEAALASHRRRADEVTRQLQQYSDLLSGKIGPDDLLPPPAVWVWDGEKYVPEQK